MNAWIGIVGVVIGGALAILSSYLQQRRQIQHDRRKLILSKLEELYEVVSGFRQTYKAEFLERSAELLSFNLPPEIKVEEPVPIERVRMLVGFYAPELSKQLQRVEETRVGYMEVISLSIKTDVQSAGGRNKVASVLSEKYSSVERACIEMQEAVIEASRKYI